MRRLRFVETKFRSPLALILATKQQRAIHSHVFDLYSAGGNSVASCLWCLLLTRAEKPFLLFRRRSRSMDPLGSRPTLIWMRPTYLPTSPAALFSERTVDKHSPPAHDFHPPASKKSRFRVSLTRVWGRNRRKSKAWKHDCKFKALFTYWLSI